MTGLQPRKRSSVSMSLASLLIGAFKSTRCQGRSVVQRFTFGPSSTRLNPQPPRASQPPHRHFFFLSSPSLFKFFALAAGLRVAIYPPFPPSLWSTPPSCSILSWPASDQQRQSSRLRSLNLPTLVVPCLSSFLSPPAGHDVAAIQYLSDL
ncbi:hypothetical protein P170DRAFT_23331 [Aspergillus steynii IBT 23096]|uniref:Uncharacterized protein n=1 Tax=Aspergillus steynii IBT 23096 TaxID=1392250 RepID=A0A2I2GP61_9EURO|nr:uncharacterized protein P170DRAFT_23331 [Aspergillus steynii IBT 23096]PLB54658.1 hypothetical protein P170DRAFT_23331 [Aspergillus steynii IBT 23096]